MPDLRLYNVACQLRFVGKWLTDNYRYCEKGLVSRMTAHWSPLCLLHLQPSQLHTLDFPKRLLNPCICAWRWLRKHQGLASTTSLLMPLLGNLDFLPGRESSGIFQHWASRGIAFTFHLYDSEFHTILDFQSLTKDYHLSPRHFFTYLQARHYLQSLSWTAEVVAAETDFATKVFDAACLNNTIVGWKTLGQARQERDFLQPLGRRWSAILTRDITEYMLSCLKILHTQNPDVGLRELQFQILHLAYYDYVRHFKMGLTDFLLCIKCGLEEGTLLHLLLQCRMLIRFWEVVLDTITRCTGIATHASADSLMTHPFRMLPPGNHSEATFGRVAALLGCRTILSVWVEPTTSPSAAAWH
ncbi:uncharacterized protein LOC115086107 [Rhinatrema bivittatum]|uniref:uncharacterized protein LOC115086107 n=1 Tax=Rhinatrema bivittatum TaxID=194408 RepID=UPI00112B4991|nr:uncharacterized protein LOC115086107 [Rhinatrema bivittatum]